MQKQTPKRKRRRKAVPVLGAAGLSLSLASGASGGPAVNMPTQKVEASHEIVLAEEDAAELAGPRARPWRPARGKIMRFLSP